MSIELPENTAIKGEAGFTMIEIVMVLVLLGILGAVAVAKYFDLKEQASAIKCEHSRSVLISQLNTAFAVTKLEDKDDFSIANIDSTIDKEMTDVGGSGCISGAVCANLCPKDGTYTVAHENNDGSVIFKISCSVHKGTGDTPSVTPPPEGPGEGTGGNGESGSEGDKPGDTTIYSDPEDKGFAGYIFGLMADNPKNSQVKADIKAFFDRYKNGKLDSECTDKDEFTKIILRKLFKNPISERWGKQICLNLRLLAGI